MFATTTYAQMYDDASQIPDDIICNNAWTTTHILQNPNKFPYADLNTVENDNAFLVEEALSRGITPHRINY